MRHFPKVAHMYCAVSSQADRLSPAALTWQEKVTWFFSLSMFRCRLGRTAYSKARKTMRSEEHTSELQSHSDLVCRLLLEKKKKKIIRTNNTKELCGLECDK